ncbi:MAG: hypothetical protein IPM69_07795 [Ignavibacteria bacterium]|nr:hypothetical protein [Ignavibacteria bacterium]
MTTPNPDFPVFLLCGVLIVSDEYEKLRASFNQIKHALWNNRDVIFHSRDIENVKRICCPI